MSDSSDDWFRDPAPRASRRAPAGSGFPGGGEPTESISAGGGEAWGSGAQLPQAGNYSGGGAWPEQPPVRVARGAGRARRSMASGGGFSGGRSSGGARRWLRPRRILAIIALLVVVILVFSGAMYFYLNSKLTRANVLVDYTGRPAASAGQNWLITGSDSRQGLTRQQERQLATGVNIGGQRSDTIMLLHIPANGGPAVLVSLPRDSYVSIPGFGMNKLNAAYSFGGPKLLAETVQNATGLQINHYMGIGFGGLVNVVNSVGGVHMCIPSALNDPASGLHLQKGCQTMGGAQALGFVRSRHLFATQDLQREQDQRVFMKALLSKMTSPGTLVNPFAMLPATVGSADALTVDPGTQLYQLAKVAFALRHPETTTVPVGSEPLLAVGDVVIWNQAQATQLFNAMKNDTPVPKSLLTGSKLVPGS
ncbi:MAG TPA: LCP family protein [Streptosporangiaceae bacterium]|nr:LCP family protein [Streptosporangiaceae bacterium]